MGCVTLDEVADALYAGGPADFVRHRDEAVKEARTAGDRDLAIAIGKLRRPTVGAWLANLLAHLHATELAELLTLGADMRDAQAQLDAASLRELGKRRQEVVRGLVATAKATASELGESAGAPAVAELEATLAAVVADPDAADQLRSGRLTTGLSYAGFGGPSTGSVTTRPAPARPKPAPTAAGGKAGSAGTVGSSGKNGKAGKPSVAPPDRSAEVDAAERDLAQARLQAAEAESDLEVARAAEAAAKATVTGLVRRTEELRRELAQVEAGAEKARKKLAWAEQDRKNAQAAVQSATRAVSASEKALARVNG